MSRFQNKVVLVTGGSSGIGLATATAFADEGARVVITGRDAEALALAEKTIGSSARGIVSDAARLVDIGALVEDIAGTEGTVDSVFVNAGSALPAPFGSVLEGNVDAMVDVHVKGPFFLLQQLTPLMPPGSTVVVNGSVSATLGMPGMSAYAVGKAGLASVVLFLASAESSFIVGHNLIADGGMSSLVA